MPSVADFLGNPLSDQWRLLEDGARELGITLTADHLAAFKKYLSELEVWNEKINLTARIGSREVILKDFFDSLSVVKYLSRNARVLDLGSGAGFPGIPVRIVREDLWVVLLEANRKKSHFLKHIIRHLGLSGIEAVWTGEGKELPLCDFVVARAFGPLGRLAATAAQYLMPEGSLIAMKGKKGEEELSAALPGVVASKTKKPVIGVPVDAKLGGLDALLSIVQMPPGVPVACVGIDNAKNAAYLAIRILTCK